MSRNDNVYQMMRDFCQTVTRYQTKDGFRTAMFIGLEKGNNISIPLMLINKNSEVIGFDLPALGRDGNIVFSSFQTSESDLENANLGSEIANLFACPIAHLVRNMTAEGRKASIKTIGLQTAFQISGLDDMSIADSYFALGFTKEGKGPFFFPVSLSKISKDDASDLTFFSEGICLSIGMPIIRMRSGAIIHSGNTSFGHQIDAVGLIKEIGTIEDFAGKTNYMYSIQLLPPLFVEMSKRYKVEPLAEQPRESK